jgi:hypothetical protein
MSILKQLFKLLRAEGKKREGSSCPSKWRPCSPPRKLRRHRTMPLNQQRSHPGDRSTHGRINLGLGRKAGMLRYTCVMTDPAEL